MTDITEINDEFYKAIVNNDPDTANSLLEKIK